MRLEESFSSFLNKFHDAFTKATLLDIILRNSKYTFFV